MERQLPCPEIGRPVHRRPPDRPGLGLTKAIIGRLSRAGVAWRVPSSALR